MSNFDWTRFTMRINVNADLAILYNAWATRKGIEEWFLRRSEYHDKDGQLKAFDERVIEGDTYRWFWHGWSDQTDEKGRILRANGVNELAFSFGKAGNCFISIQPYNNEYMVELIQDQIPDTEEGRQNYHLGCKQGWTFYLTNLKSMLEGGIDLRHRDIATTEMANK